jgi:hypothetical protein
MLSIHSTVEPIVVGLQMVAAPAYCLLSTRAAGVAAGKGSPCTALRRHKRSNVNCPIAAAGNVESERLTDLEGEV